MPYAIRLKNVSKKFGNVWIFKNVNADFEPGKKYALTGPNGSGKSTLLKIIAGIITPNRGEIAFGSKFAYNEISFCAPYLELPEELTLDELFAFHKELRTINISIENFVVEMQIDPKKEIRNYSSGMKQRIKLALALYTESMVVLLDEPCANLDAHWTGWYLQKVKQITAEKLLVISSNIPAEYDFCDTVFDISDFVK